MFLKTIEDVIKEHIERKDELRRVLNKYEKDYKKNITRIDN